MSVDLSNQPPLLVFVVEDEVLIQELLAGLSKTLGIRFSAKFFGIASARTSVGTIAKLPRPAHVETEEPVLEGEILTDNEPPRWQQGSQSHRSDIAAVINNALGAAGLIKE